MAIATVTGGGVFSKKNIADINNNFAALTQPNIWVRPQYGNNSTADGTYAKPYATIGGALSSPLCVPGVVIGLLGVTKEEVTGPIVNDITILGMGNQPRQATTSGIANGGGATWMSSSASASTPLLISSYPRWAWVCHSARRTGSSGGATRENLRRGAGSWATPMSWSMPPMPASWMMPFQRP